MAYTELVVDALSGADDADIEGRVPDGGGDAGKAVGVWGINGELASLGAFDAPDNLVNLVSGTLRNTGADDFIDTVYTVQGIPLLEQNQYASATGRFHTLTGDSWFGVVLRFDPALNVGYFVYLGDWGELLIGMASPSTWVTIRTIEVEVLEDTDYTITAAIEGATLKLYLDGTEVGCQPNSVVYEGDPGIVMGDTLGDGSGLEISQFSAGNGDPYFSESGGKRIGVRHHVSFKQSQSARVRHIAEWKPFLKAWQRQGGAWHLAHDAAGGSPDHCGRKTVGELLRCLRYISGKVHGPNGGSLALVSIDVVTGAVTSVAAVHDGAEMEAYGSVAGSTAAMTGKMFTPGALGLGVNVVTVSSGAIVGWDTPTAPFGVACRGAQNYLLFYDTIGYLAIRGATRTEQPIGERVFFTAGETVSITVDDHTYYNDYGGAGGAMRLWHDTTCAADIAAHAPGFYPTLLGTIGTTLAAFPGNTYPVKNDATSAYITNYLEIYGTGADDSTRFRYGVICSRRQGHAQPKDITISETDPGTECEVTSDNEDTSLTFFDDVNNWEVEPEAVYVGAKDSGTVWALDPSAAGAELYDFDTGLTETRGMAVTISSAGFALVVGGGGVVKCFDAGTNAERWSTAVGAGVYYVYAQPNANKIWVSCTTDNEVWVLDGTSGAVLATIAVGTSPRQIVRHSAADRIYVVNEGDDTISVIHPTSYTVERMLATFDQPFGVAYDDSRRVAWVGHATVQPLLAV